MKKTLLFFRLIAIGLMMLFSSGWAVGQTVIIDFETEGDGYTPSGTEGSSFTDVFNRTNPDVGGNSTYIWAVEDINLTNPSITLDQIDITGASSFTFSIDMIAHHYNDWDNNEELLITYSIDGGASQNLMWVQNTGEEYNDPAALDTDFDGDGECANVLPALTTGTGTDGCEVSSNVFETFVTNSISLSSNSTLDIELQFNGFTATDEGIYLDNIKIELTSGAASPTITLSTTTLTDFSYEEGNGPSAEQSFTVEGSDLTDDITLTPPTNYEISTATGGSFSATNPITLAQSGGSVASTTIYTRLKAGLAEGDYNAEDITAASTDADNKTVTCSGSVYNQLDWGNLQYPENGAIARGGDFTVYAQAYELGVTDAAGQGAGITAWIGYSTSDTDPSTWTNWVEATYNTDSGNNDEYMANIGAAIAAPGVYYYASRFQLGSAPYYYGGYNSGGGGAWDGTTNVSGQLTITGVVSVIINEVDADTEETDTEEFVELYDGGAGNTALDGLVVVLFNGSNDLSYKAIDLDSYSSDANGYFVIGNTAVENVDLVIPSNTLQNGADAVALYYGSDSDFPNDTPVTTTNLIDAIVYDTDDGDDAALLVLLNASEPQVNENEKGDKEYHSMQRISNGSGGFRNTTTYTQETPTPGSKNLAETEWIGTTDTDWATNGNWSNGVPTVDHNVIIPGSLTNYPDIASATSATCNIIEIQSGASLSVTGTLTPSGTTGGIIINSEASASGSLIVTGTLVSVTTKSSQVAPSSTITYKCYVTAGQWHLLSAPVDGQEISSMLTDADNDIELSGSDYSMKDYDEGSDSWNALFTSATAGDMGVGLGYVVTRATDGTITMEGEYASADFTVALARAGNGWNLLGNPYPSAIVASRASDENYLLNTANVNEMDPAYAAIYVWDENTADPTNVNNYKTMNNAGTGNLTKSSQVNPQVDYLQAGQGFFVKAKTSRVILLSIHQCK